MKKVVLITGSSSSMGAELAKKYIENDYITYGLALDTQNLPGLNYAFCDVTNFKTCQVVVEKIISERGRIDVLINNASVQSKISPLEYYSKKEIENYFQVNFLGTLNMIRAVLPYMRKQKQGRIINISAVSPSVGVPYQSLFSASNAAIDSLSSALRVELEEFNIDVTTVHAKRVNFQQDAASTIKETDDYYASYNRAFKLLQQEHNTQVKPKRIARAVYSLSIKKNPPEKLYIGIKNSITRTFFKLFPRRVREKKVYNKYIKEKDADKAADNITTPNTDKSVASSTENTIDNGTE